MAKSLSVTLPGGRVVSFHVYDGAESRALMTELQRDNPKGSAEKLWLDHAVALAKYVIDKDAGEAPTLDWRDRFDKWSPREIAYYETVYGTLVNLTDEERAQAESAAKSLRDGP